MSASVNRRLALLEGLYAFVNSQLASRDFDAALDSFSAGLYAAAPGIRAIEVIPGTVIQHVYPVAGNEAAVGHDLSTDPRPEIRADLERARNTGRYTLSGPLELRQGGLGLVARRAVFRDARLWGFVTIVLDVRPIIREATVGPQQIRFAVRDGRGRVFQGDPAIFASNPVVVRVDIPDGFWEVGAVPVRGWPPGPGKAIPIYRALGLSLALLLCVVVYLVTERQARLSRAVRAGEEQYRLVTESVPVIIALFDNLERCRFANRAHETWFGCRPEELIGQPLREIFGDEVYRSIRDQIALVVRGKPVSFDAAIARPEGGTRQVNATCVPHWSEEKAPDGFYLVASDITDRKQAELAVQRSEARLARAQAIAKLGSWELDLTTMDSEWSDEGYRILGLARTGARLSLQDLIARVHPQDRSAVLAALQAAVVERTPLQLEHRLAMGDGEERHLRVQSEIEYENGKPVLLTGTVQDVTEYRQLEAQLQQAQKMEAIGLLAGGVAHDFNNLLTVIAGYAQLALDGVQESDPLRERLIEIRKAGERAAALTRQLLAFSRRQVLQPKVLNLNTIVAELQKLLRRLIGENIALVTKLDPSLPPVTVDAGQMEQVIVNLAVNARDAMPEGGTLTIETAVVQIPDPAPEGSAAGPGPYAVVRISDTGTGIDPEIQPRIFEPFFTTKEKGKGTGLGLSTVYGIVKQSGGEITFASEAGRGTVFTLFMPAFAGEAAEQRAEAPPGTLRGAEAILLVEDEDGVRSLATLVLRQLGYEVLAAADAAEAMELFNGRGGAVDLLLTDVIMPGASGRELAEGLQRVRPDLKVLYMSGYTHNEIVDAAVLGDDLRFIQKPFAPQALGKAVRAVLDTRLRNSTILIVDDEPAVRELLRATLARAGYRVVEAAGGTAALARVSESPVDLIITDLVMPDEEGLGLISKIRRSNPSMKIIAMSGAFGGEYLRIARLLGAVGTVSKPFRTDELLRTVEQALRS